jgi:phosphopantetheine adenylyltransferase
LAKPLWQHVRVARIDPDDPRLTPVRDAVAALKAAEEAVKQRRAELGKAVADAIRNDVGPAVLVRETGKSAESIRTMARENGVEPLRDPRGAAKSAAKRAADS